jgi:hypothetical protein
MNPISPFDRLGLLPQDACATLEELRGSHLVTGRGVGSPTWDRAWRQELVERLERVFTLFHAAGGVEEFWIDGSFVEAVDRPEDIDAYFTLPDPREWPAFPNRLNALEGEEIWTWDLARRRVYSGSIHPKPPFWGRYRVDIFPDFGRPSGIFDANGRPMTFAEAFRQQRRTFRRKGIVRLRRGS